MRWTNGVRSQSHTMKRSQMGRNKQTCCMEEMDEWDERTPQEG